MLAAVVNDKRWQVAADVGNRRKMPELLRAVSPEKGCKDRLLVLYDLHNKNNSGNYIQTGYMYNVLLNDYNNHDTIISAKLKRSRRNNLATFQPLSRVRIRTRKSFRFAPPSYEERGQFP